MVANWHPDRSRGIQRRIVVTGTLVLDTPTALSTGETNGTELIILQDALDGRPLLPGASIAGALRAHLLSREVGYTVADNDKTLTSALFGKALDEGTERMESRLLVHDALGDPEKSELTRREGVKIAGDTRTADDGMLFSTQVWAAGTTFDLRFELVLYAGDPDDLLAGAAVALSALGQGEIALGGRKGRGYGRVRVENWQVCLYDMANPADLLAWLRNELHTNFAEDFFALANRFVDHRQYVHIRADLQLCDSLLIRAPSDIAESEHLSSNDQPVLSGTSLAGALRACCLKIANTVNPNNQEQAAALVDDLFGKHGANGDTDNLSASRVSISEQRITGGRTDLIQNRVKIDRFTGGAFETALFDERPLFADDDTRVKLDWWLCYPADGAEHKRLNAQVGLLLLALKDLWTEDLALGGEASIGRGRWRGQSGTLTVKKAQAAPPDTYQLNAEGLVDATQATTLQSFVDALWQYTTTQEANT